MRSFVSAGLAAAVMCCSAVAQASQLRIGLTETTVSVEGLAPRGEAVVVGVTRLSGINSAIVSHQSDAIADQDGDGVVTKTLPAPTPWK